jgi:hypothetical protein
VACVDCALIYRVSAITQLRKAMEQAQLALLDMDFSAMKSLCSSCSTPRRQKLALLQCTTLFSPLPCLSIIFAFYVF